ncbi:MAG TPA: hypothetical protein VKR58_14940, partial [Aquella sp.]|nr:hypothetical protein [Aquella sp.]
DPKQTLTSTWLDIYSQFFMKPGFSKQYRVNNGDSKYAPKWASELEPFTVKVPLPFFFDRRRSVSLPLFLCSLSKVEIKGKFRTKLSELIKMRYRMDGDVPEWIETPYKWNMMHEIHSPDEEVKAPIELYAGYSKINKEEREGWKELIESTHTKSYKLLYDDIITISSDKVHTEADPFIHDLFCKTPAKALFWVAQNQEGLQYNNYSNYTTNSLDINSGKSPITEVSIKHGGTTWRHQDASSAHFDSMQAWYHTSSAPFEPGYQCLIYSPNPLGTDADIGAIFDGEVKTSISLSLKNISKKQMASAPVENEDAFLANFKENAKVDTNLLKKYKIYVFIMCMKKMEFFLNEKVRVYDGNDRIKSS